MTFFGPVFTLAAIFLLVHSVMIRAFDRWFAAGYAVMIITYFAVERDHGGNISPTRPVFMPRNKARLR
jgi:hypothetical protein